MNPTPPAAGPIVVNATPGSDQRGALVRQITLILGPVAAFAAASHMTGLSNDLNLAIAIVGPVSAAVSLVWGQLVTRKASKDKAKMANALPDSVAVAK